MNDILYIIFNIFKFIGNLLLLFLPWWVWVLLIIIIIIGLVIYFNVIKPATD